MASNDVHLPLSHKVFHILMAVAEEPRNGYTIGLAVEEASGGVIRMSPGTLYESLHRLNRQGLIQEVETGLEGRRDGRGQRFYALTGRGTEVLKAEVARLAGDVSRARSLPALG